MTQELRDEIPQLIESLESLETLLSLEAQLVEEGDYDLLEKIRAEKELKLPVINRANSVLRAIAKHEGGLNIEEDDELFDLAVTMMNVNRAAIANEQVIIGAIRATQYTVRAIVQAMRKGADRGLNRYTQHGNVVALTAAQTRQAQQM